VFATYTTWAFLGAILILDTRESVAKFLMASVWITAVLGGLGFIGFVTGIQLLYDPNAVERTRASVGVGNPIVLARAGCASILIFVWMFLQTNRENRNMIYLLLLLVYFAIMVIASGSRAPILACIIAGAVLVMSASFSPKAAARSLKLIITTLLTGVILVAVISNTSKFDDVVDRIGELVTSGAQTKTFEYRRDSWELAYDMFRQSPAIGHGIGSFKKFNFGSQQYIPEQKVYPHNIVWELLSETGLVGLFLFSLLHIPVFRLLTSRKRRNEDFTTSLRGMVFVFWFFCFINALSSGDINDNRVMFCLLGLTANAARWSAPEKRLQNSKRRSGNLSESVICTSLCLQRRRFD
jgi:O-antigen ligase